MLGDSSENIRRIATEFSAAVAAGNAVRVDGASVLQHLLVLHELLATQPIVVCKKYAGLAEIPFGRFSSLDALRMLVLKAPDSVAGDVGDFPLQMPGENYVVFALPGATRMLFVFTGAAHQFGGPLRLMHQWFRRLNVSVVYLFDRDWTYYLGGIRGLADTVEGAAHALRRIAEQAGATSHLCVGNSGGGFGALLYATHLSAVRTLAFSPPTAIQESLDIVMRKVPHLGEMLTGADAIDLRSIYARSAVPYDCRIFYPEMNDHDRSEALNLAGLEGCNLIGMPGVRSHNLLPNLVLTDRFGQELSWLVNG